ncbi:MAG: hypothetical protein M0Q51_12095 [Bacteroidales bacterium]|nr:hypothetical protein [Bacteroidales bacterium]
MEKLLEELISRLEDARDGIVRELKSDSDEANNQIAMLLSGEAFAYDYCIKELQRLINYYKESILKS